MAELIIIVLILVYCVYLVIRKIKKIKKGQWCSCGCDGCGTDCPVKNKQQERE